MKKIMILGASILQLPAIKKAKELGLKTVVVDMNPKAVGFEVDGIEKEIISTIDVPKIILAAKRHKIDGIMTLASDMPMRAVAAVSEELGLVGITRETALKATNKAFMRDALKKNGVPIPLYHKVTDYVSFSSAVKDIINKGYKCIIKPADSSGSRGVYLISEINTINLKDIYIYSKQHSKLGELVVEEFMEGPEVSVETLSLDGKCNIIQITDKITTGEPFFVEMGHSQPSLLAPDLQEKIKEITVKANKAIGITVGPSHTEIKVTKDGPKIVELGARLGGDNITTHLVPLSTGIDIVECCIKLSLGERPDITPKFEKGSAIRYFKQCAGVIKDIIGIEGASKISGVKQISIVHGIGEEISGIVDSGSRMGFVIAQSNDAKQAIEICNKVLDSVIIDIMKVEK